MSNIGIPVGEKIGLCGPSREPAQAVLLGMIKTLDKKLAPLQTLAAHIPWEKLTKEEEESLWEFFCNLRRELR